MARPQKRNSRLFQTKKSPLTDFIYKHFIEPIETSLKLTTEDALSLWLGIKHRDMYFCKCDVPFKMPGVETKPHPHIVHGTLNREVKTGSSIVVRIDKRTPNRIDVDFSTGDDVRTFLLTSAEYELLREKVEVLY